MAMSLLNKTCSIISRTAGTADIYGNVTQGIAGTVSVACDIQQIRRTEPSEEGEFSVTEWAAFFPSGTALDTGDLVTESSLGTFEVIGRPWDADQGSVAVNHVEATLKVSE